MGLQELDMIEQLSRSVYLMGFPGGSVVKKPPANAGDIDLIPGGGNGNPLQYSCLENPIDRGAWPAAFHRVAQSDMTEHAHTSQYM